MYQDGGALAPLSPPDSLVAARLGEGGTCAEPDQTAPQGMLRGGDTFKPEAAIFLFVILTFAAVLWEDSFREKRFSLMDYRSQFLPYFYSDGDEGGASSVVIDDDDTSIWTCNLVAEAQYPYCGYGLQLDGAKRSGKSFDLSQFDTVNLVLDYEGPPTRLKLTLKNDDPAYSLANTGRSTMPVVAEFDVKNGRNTIELALATFTVDQWWLDQQAASNANLAPNLSHVVAIDFVSGGGVGPGEYTMRVESVAFSGILITSAQWYLLILGIWLVLTGLFLVYRFAVVRRNYEVRHLAQARESRELSLARTAAEAASDAKSQFLANMSHELRTPLNAILGYAQLLSREELSDRQRTAVGTIDQSGRHLLMLITDILDLSKIEAGKLDIVTAPFDFRACVVHVANMIRPRTEERGLGFKVDIAEDVPRELVGDAKRVRQILLNLLSNAVKFTFEGEVHLDISVAEWAEGKVRLRMDVIDTGQGIEEDQVERLFEPFEQAGSAVDRSGGTGLGLSITRRLVQALNGSIIVDSTVDLGSRFTVEIECTLAAMSRDKVMPLVHKPRVLIVDDDVRTCDLLSEALTLLGALPTTAQDGASALEACTHERPALVFMDMKMPGMSGLTTIDIMKRNALLRELPVVAISAASGETLEADALAAGAVRLLQKPVNIDALKECLNLASPTEEKITDEHGELYMVLPSECAMRKLLDLARAGNMRAIRREVLAMAKSDPAIQAFAERLGGLAAAYQSPAVLRLVEQNMHRVGAA